MADRTEITGSQNIAWPKRKSGFLASANPAEERDIIIRWLQEVLGAGKPLDETTRRRAESWFGRNLADVRIHDSRQAAELAKKLDAEAFAVRSHIFGPAEKLRALTPQGGGLLAHEITHVVQQTDPQYLSHESDRTTTPQESQPVLPAGSWRQHGTGFLPSSRLENQQPPFQRTVSSPSRGGLGQISLQVGNKVLQRAAEEEAQATEEVVSRALENQEPLNHRSSDAVKQIDLQELASNVYSLMRQELVHERERGAIPG